MRVGRNESCPCGSGKKFKACCAGKSSRTSRGMAMLVGTIGVIAAVGIIASVRDTGSDNTNVAGVVSPRSARPQPGPAPAGKVWSAEHGHWHDVNAN